MCENCEVILNMLGKDNLINIKPKPDMEWHTDWLFDKEYRKSAPKVAIAGTSMSFSAIIDEIIDLHDRKQQDYGRPQDPYANVKASEDFGISPWVGTLVRANDKMRRLQKAAQGESLTNESIEDSLLDLATYVIIALDLFRKETNLDWLDAWGD